MKNIFTALSIFGSLFLNAQDCTLSLGETLKLAFPDGDGTNGACVTYDAGQNQYHASFAGNGEFPYCIFDKNGKMLREKTAGEDVRGIWINKDGSVGMNIYNGVNQPDAQAVGAYNAKKNEVIYYHEGSIYIYKNSSDAPKPKKVDLKISNTDVINNTSVGYTGMKKKEVVLLDYENSKLLFFDIKSGKQTACAVIPAVVILEGSFNFAFCNGMAWFFSIDNREWAGYKVK